MFFEATQGRTQRSSHLAPPKALFRVLIGDVGLNRGPGVCITKQPWPGCDPLPVTELALSELHSLLRGDLSCQNCEISGRQIPPPPCLASAFSFPRGVRPLEEFRCPGESGCNSLIARGRSQVSVLTSASAPSLGSTGSRCPSWLCFVIRGGAEATPVTGRQVTTTPDQLPRGVRPPPLPALGRRKCLPFSESLNCPVPAHLSKELRSARPPAVIARNPTSSWRRGVAGGTGTRMCAQGPVVS